MPEPAGCAARQPAARPTWLPWPQWHLVAAANNAKSTERSPSVSTSRRGSIRRRPLQPPTSSPARTRITLSPDCSMAARPSPRSSLTMPSSTTLGGGGGGGGGGSGRATTATGLAAAAASAREQRPRQRRRQLIKRLKLHRIIDRGRAACFRRARPSRARDRDAEAEGRDDRPVSRWTNAHRCPVHCRCRQARINLHHAIACCKASSRHHQAIIDVCD